MDFFYGSAPCNISDLLRSAPELVAGHAMLVSRLYKSDRVGEVLAGGFDRAAVDYRGYGTTALIAAGDVEAFLRGSYLSRFDELWFFRDVTVRRELAFESRRPPQFTSDVQDFTRPPSNEFLEYFAYVGAHVALADGFDLNYASQDREIVRAIDGLRF